MKVTNCTKLWNTMFTWYSPCATRWIYLYDLKYRLGIHGFRLTWPFLIVELLVTREKCLEPSGYCTVIKCAFTCHKINILFAFTALWPSLTKQKLSSRIWIRWIFFYATWNSHTEWSTVQRVSARSTTIQSSTVCT